MEKILFHSENNLSYGETSILWNETIISSLGTISGVWVDVLWKLNVSILAHVLSVRKTITLHEKAIAHWVNADYSIKKIMIFV